MNSRHVHAFISLGGTDHFVGQLWCHSRKGKESSTFEYDKSWLHHKERFALEPALTLTPGSFHTQAHQSIFGSIGDSAPDRWGRILMRRAENQRAKQAKETPRSLMEIDYLLGGSDEARQGALRFRDNIHGSFLGIPHKKSIPPLVDLPKLLAAAEHFLMDEESAQELQLLLAPGSPLGGARPKASVRDKDGHLSIAKFPHKDDEFNIMAWESIAYTLAKQAGIATPDWRLENINAHPVLIVRRFDRQGAVRIPFLSAMSMLGAHDHEQHSYLEIADALAQYGAEPNADMAELWRRMVFNILISNTDDHLRNHGFLYESNKGWRLSPVYDINPTPTEVKPRILTTTIDLTDGTASLDLALSVIGHFRLSLSQAQTIVKEVSLACSQWGSLAQQSGLSKKETDRMATAFEHKDLEEARKM